MRPVWIFGLAMTLGAFAATKAEAQLFTTYQFSGQQFSWLTCGSVPGSEGCYGAGTVSGFGQICAVLEDPERMQAGGSNQRIYVMDKDATGNKDVVLHVLQKKIAISGGSATTIFVKKADVALPLVGAGTCQAAANKVAILAGTSKSTNAAYILKKTLAASAYGGFSPPAQVTSITVDAGGYIAVDFAGGFYLIGPQGEG